MTPVEIAYFKHFMFDKGLERSFQYFYRTRRIKGSPQGDKDGNPESIEEFLQKVSRKDVIMKAFYFSPMNNNAQKADQTFDYWKDIDDKWQTYMDDNETNFSNDTWPTLRKSFAILRQNWDVPYYWKPENLESTEEVYKRMHIDMPLPEFQWTHGTMPPKNTRNDAEEIQTNIHNAKDGDVLVRIHKKEDFTSRVIILFRELFPFEVDGLKLQKARTYASYNIGRKRLKIANDVQGDIIVNDEAKDVCYRLAFEGERNMLMKELEEVGLKWDENEKALIPLAEEKEEEQQPLVDFAEEADDPLADFDFFDDVLPGQYRLKSNEVSVNFYKGNKITFNQIDSKVIRESGLKFLRLAKNKANDICFIINRQKGANITNLSGKTGNMNATINSVDICRKLRTLFNLKSDYSILRVEKLQVTQEFIIYKITKQ